jgi:hypothetical protein
MHSGIRSPFIYSMPVAALNLSATTSDIGIFKNTRIYGQISNPLREQTFRDLERHRKLFDFNGFAIALIPAFPNARPRSIGKHAAGAIQQNRNRG